MTTTLTGQLYGINAEGMLGNGSVDLTITSGQVIFNVPTGRSCIVTKIVVRQPTTSLTLATFSCGFNGSANDVIALTGYTALVNSSLFSITSPLLGAAVGTSTASFTLKCTAVQLTAASVTVDVFGYLI